MSAPPSSQFQDACHLNFRLAHNQFYPAHAHLSESCLKRLSVVAVCTRAVTELTRTISLTDAVYLVRVISCPCERSLSRPTKQDTWAGNILFSIASRIAMQVTAIANQ